MSGYDCRKICKESGKEPSITGKAAEIYAARDGTEKQNNKAVSDWTVRWLTVFETVFDLDEVPELKHVFYGASITSIGVNNFLSRNIVSIRFVILVFELIASCQFL